MKQASRVAVVGGGGVRVPLLLSGLLRRAAAIGLQEVRLHDTDLAHASLMRVLGEALQARHGTAVRITVQEDLDAAIEGTAFVFSAVRIGGAEGRIHDERIALRHGLLGQETTGIGGMSMALRTIPFAVHLAERIKALAPGAWFLNFTNPSGLIVEALRLAGQPRVIGLCDAPSGLKSDICRHLSLDEASVSLGYQGLNHLGWVDSLRIGGEERLGDLLQDAQALADGVRSLGFFGAELLRGLGLLPNEYLYYFYFRRDALARELQAEQTRGEMVRDWNARIYRDTSQALAGADGAQDAVERYRAILAERRNSYMAEVTHSGHDRGITADTIFREEGYEGLALRTMTALLGGTPAELVLNVPNEGACDALMPDEVGELTCLVDAQGAHPRAAAPLPFGPRGLVRSIKDYELLTAQAAFSGSRETLLEAAQAHPLIGDRNQAARCLDELLAAHRKDLPQFA